jgi:hypothetical protein
VVFAVLSLIGALKITGMLGLPASSIFVQVKGYRIVILLGGFT